MNMSIYELHELAVEQLRTELWWERMDTAYANEIEYRARVVRWSETRNWWVYADEPFGDPGLFDEYSYSYRS